MGYKIFAIRQNNKLRIIQEPDEELKQLQRSYIKFFDLYDAFYPGCTARVGKSVLDNAAPHHGSRIIFKTDIKSFYPSIKLEHLLRNFDLDSRQEWKNEARKRIKDCLIDIEGDMALPTGAPTSPVLSCIAATDLDMALSLVAHEFGFLYTRYIDDLTFSSKASEPCRELAKKVTDTIRDYGFRFNYKKTNWVWLKGDKKFAVTGVVLKSEGYNSRVLKEIRRICRARLDKVALNNIPLDKVTQGYMSYIKMLDIETHEKLTDYLERRKVRYVGVERPCSSAQ